MNLLRKCLLCAALLAATLTYAGATDSQTIQANIDQAKAKQQQAHQIAEYVRSFGEDESNPAILFAQEKWSEQSTILDGLYQQYNEAVEQEARLKELEAIQRELEEQQRARGVYLGRFRISHYCPCAACNGGNSRTATGAPLTSWYSVAVDPSVIPLNSTVYIDGYGTFQAQDTGSAIRGNRVDVCVSSHSEAMRLGVVYRDVYIR